MKTGSPGKRMGSALLVAIVLALLSWRACSRLWSERATVNATRLFHQLKPGAPARFLIRGANDLHLVSYFALDGGGPPRTQYSLQVTFVAPDGRVQQERAFYLSVDPNPEGPTLLDGTKLARVRLLRLIPPAGSTILRVASPDGRVLMQAGWLTSRHPSREALLRRSGIPLSWFATDELAEVRSQRFMRLTELEQLPSVLLQFPDSSKSPDTALKLPEPLRVGPHRAIVWNVIGPGSLEVSLHDPGYYALEYIGVGGAGHAPVESGHAELELPAGPSSVILRALGGNSSDVQLLTRKLRPLDGATAALMPAERWVSAWRTDGATPLRFPMYGRKQTPLPIRLSARALTEQSEPLRWRFLDERGRRLQEGQLPLEDQYDAFAGAELDGRTADVRLAGQVLLMPPKGTAVLVLSGERMIAEVDVLLEEGAQTGYLPPYDIELRRGLHFRDAPSRLPRWLMLAPLGTEDEQRHLRVQALRMPRIEPIVPFQELGPWVSLMPRGAVQQGEVAEPARHLSAEDSAVTVVATGKEAAMVIAAKGKNARRVNVTCDLPDRLGGRMSLLVDGKTVGSAPILLGTMRLQAQASAGVHRVMVSSAQRGHCAIDGKTVEGPITVRRKIYKFREHKGALQVRVTTHRRRPMHVYYALYSDDPAAQRQTSYSVQIDRGPHLAHAPQAATRPAGEHAAPAAIPVHMLHTHRTLFRVAVSAVRLGRELPAGRHLVTLTPSSPFRYWARFWIHGHRKAGPKAESWISSESLAHSESWE